MTNDNKSPFDNDESVYGKGIKSEPIPKAEIGIDTNNTFYKNIILSSELDGVASSIDLSRINSFSDTAQSRDQVYTILDSMAMDSKVAAILETYAADSTEYNDEGKIVWVDSSDGKVSEYVSYLLDTLQVDKHIYGWVYSLIKYGDLYLRLYKESEYDNSVLFDGAKEKESLNENIYIKAFPKNDRFVHYVEAMPNPAEIFELTKFGKTQAYIKTSMSVQQAQNENPAGFTNFFRYSFSRGDVEIYQPNMFVHACLDDTSTRTPETVEIFRENTANAETGESNKISYQVRRGKSIIYDSFKVWRILTLLENSMLLNRLTKSAILRIIGVEVGDMSKDDIRKHLTRIKGLMEQKSSLKVGESMSEYTNPGPMENNVYVPTKDGKGSITVTPIGGDVNIKDIADIDYFTNLFYGSMRVPKAYFGFTDDGAGFNGGTSLSIISSRYAKEVKRIQNTIAQAITTAINIILIDNGMNGYVNHFTIRMLAPTTQEELDRRNNISNRLQTVRDVMDILSNEVDDPIIKLKITKEMMASAITNSEVIRLLDEQIAKKESMDSQEVSDDGGFGDEDIEREPLGLGNGASLNDAAFGEEAQTEEKESAENEEETTYREEQSLPTANELGIDMTNNEE